ncbi:hypothetical protein C8F04DRAFT_1191163 [Mycena alexandri]|uniref:Uncharacterized protein n=1 Tax=Mycena alexandri TaxID=1745969 RepID=A0AAD6SGM2_9AGAR|nr:hypothetical protein C8F04DRAFT_1191163 [Mycena alexandri]
MYLALGHRRHRPRTAQPLQSVIEHLDATMGEDGNPVIPADALVDVFRSFAEQYGGMELWAADEVAMLEQLICEWRWRLLRRRSDEAQFAPQSARRQRQPQRDWSGSGSSLSGEGRRNGGSTAGEITRASRNDSVGTHQNDRIRAGRPPGLMTDQLGQEASASPPPERRGESERFRGGYFTSLLFAWNWAGRWETVARLDAS